MADPTTPFPWSLGQFTSQDQINQVEQEMTRRAQSVGGFASEDDLLTHFVQSLDTLKIPRAEVPDSVLGNVAKGVAKSVTSLPKLGGALIEAAGGALGLDSVKTFGQGARKYYEGVEQKHLSISPEAQAFARADDTFWTVPQVSQGVGQGLGDLIQMLATGGLSAAATAGKVTAEVGAKYAAKEAAGLAVESATKKAVAETLAGRAGKTVGTRAAMAVGGFKGGGATAEQLNQTAQTQGDYARSLLAAIPSAIVNGYADTMIMRYLPQWESIPPRERGTLLQGIMSGIKTFGQGAAVEGGTEGVQSLLDSTIQSAALRLSSHPQELPTISQALKQALFEAGIGALTGGAVTTTGNIGNVQGSDYQPPRTQSPWQENQNPDTPLNLESIRPPTRAWKSVESPARESEPPLQMPGLNVLPEGETGLPSQPVSENALLLPEAPSPYSLAPDYNVGILKPQEVEPKPAPGVRPVSEPQESSFYPHAPWMPTNLEVVPLTEQVIGGQPAAPAPALAPQMGTQDLGVEKTPQMQVPDLSAREASDTAHGLINKLNAERIALQAELETETTPERKTEIQTRLKGIETEGNQILDDFAKQQAKIAETIQGVEGTTITAGDVQILAKGGKTIVIRTGKSKAAPAKTGKKNPKNLQEDLSGIRGTEEGLNGETVYVTRPDGQTVAVQTDSLITLINPKADTLFHEKMHAWMRLFLTDKQTDILIGLYKTPEKVADVYGKWAEKRSKGHPLFQKLRDLATDLYHLATLQRQKFQAEQLFRSVYREDVPDQAVRSHETGKHYQTDLKASEQIIRPQMFHQKLADRFRDMTKRAPREWLGGYEDLRYLEDYEAERRANIDPSKMTRVERFLYNWWHGGKWKLGQDARDANPEGSAYYAMTRMVNEMSARITALRGGTVRDMHGNEVAGISNMSQILKGLDRSDLDTLGAYLYALSARDRHALGKGPEGYSVQDAELDIAKVQKTRPDLVETQKKLKDLGDTALHWLVEVGQMGEDEYNLLRTTHQNYSPFWAITEAVGHMELGNVREAQLPVHKAFGGSTAVESPLISFQKNIEAYARIAERIQAEKKAIDALSRMTQHSPEGAPVIEKLDPSSKEFQSMVKFLSIDSGKLIHALEKAGALELTEIPEGNDLEIDAQTAPTVMAQIALSMEGRKSDAKALTFLRPVWTNGRLRYEVYKAHDRQIFNIFTDFDKDNSALINAAKKVEPFFGPFARLQRAFITMSPNFSAGNPVRDVFMHALLAPDTKGLPLGKQIAARMPHLRGLLLYLRKETRDGIIKQFNESAMTQNTLVRAALEQSASKVERDLRRSDSGVWNTVMHPIEALNEIAGWVSKYPEMLANFSENVGRIGVYDRVYQQEIAKGKTPEQAANYAFVKTVNAPQNFSRMGIKVQALNKISAFFGAQVGGWYRLYEFARTNPQAMTGFAAAMATASIALMMSNRDDERWKDIPEYAKDMYWFVLMKGAPVIQIPKPFEAGTFFGSVPERIAEMMVEESPNETRKIWDAVTAFNVPTPMPTVLAPVLQNALNRDWKGSPIVSQGMENLSPEAQVSPYTSELAQMLASSIRGLAPKFIEETLEKARLTSPLGVDNLLRAYGGSLGRNFTDVATDPLIRLAHGGPARKPGPSNTLSDVPGLSRFVSRYPSTAAQPMGDFYDLFNEAQQAHTTLLNLRKQADPRKTQAFATENRIPLMAYKRLQDTAETLKKLNRSYKAVQAHTTMSREEKRMRMDALAARMARIAESANTFYLRVEERNQKAPAA